MEITSRQNERVKRAKKLYSSAAERTEAGELICDGRKLYEEAVKWGIELSEIFYCGAEPEKIPAGARAYGVSRELIEYISGLKTPQNIIFTAKIPEKRADLSLSGAVILENIQDPGNVGTMLRTASAFGLNVVLTGSCADPWSPKTLRAGMGAQFRRTPAKMTVEELRESGAVIYGAALGEKSADVRSIDLTACAVAIGNEGSGLSAQMRGILEGEVIIPMLPECESLNAAAAASIIMWEMSRERL